MIMKFAQENLILCCPIALSILVFIVCADRFGFADTPLLYAAVIGSGKKESPSGAHTTKFTQTFCTQYVRKG